MGIFLTNPNIFKQVVVSTMTRSLLYKRFMEELMEKISGFSKKEWEEKKIDLIKLLVNVEEERDYVLSQLGHDPPEAIVRYYENEIKKLEQQLDEIKKMLKMF